METKDFELLAAIETGTADQVVELLATGANPNGAAETPDGELAEFKHSPLVVAVVAGSPQKVAALLAAHANTRDLVDQKSYPWTGALVDNALHHLIDNCISLKPTALCDVGELLLASGLDVNERDATGYTALHRAVFYNHAGACRLLLDRGADPTIVSDEWERTTPIEVAVELNHVALVDLFMQACATRKIEMARLITPLHWLAQCGDWEAKLLPLLELGVDINACDNRGNRPLDLLPQSGKSHLKAFYAYVAAGAQPTSELLDLYGEDSLIGEALRTDQLHAAVGCGSSEMVVKVLWQLPAIAGSGDVGIVQSALRAADEKSAFHLRQWLAKQAAEQALADIRASQEISVT